MIAPLTFSDPSKDAPENARRLGSRVAEELMHPTRLLTSQFHFHLVPERIPELDRGSTHLRPRERCDFDLKLFSFIQPFYAISTSGLTLPCEAALVGRVVVANREGAADFDDDVPLPSEFKSGKFDASATYGLHKDCLQDKGRPFLGGVWNRSRGHEPGTSFRSTFSFSALIRLRGVARLDISGLLL